MFTTAEIKILAGVLLLAAVCTGIWLYNQHEQAIGHEKAVADQLVKDLAIEKANRVESDRRTTAVQEKANVADAKASAARADADAARTAGDRLRIRLATAERARAGNPPASGASAPAGGAPSLVPFDVFERVRVAAGQFASFADDLSIRLDACVGSYESLTPQPPMKGTP